MSRPSFHFTPEKNWMNDPNGLIYLNDRYHLFYQHNHLDNQFGNIGWGHATSEDLESWTHLPNAFEGSESRMFFSGCTVFDMDNHLQLEGGPALIAIYTEHLITGEDEYSERICWAASQDDGMTWYHPRNHVLVEHLEPDFRDPKVFWHKQSNAWIMVVALPKKYTILTYRSTNLLDWKECGSFSAKIPRNQIWECPDLFPLRNEKGEEKWILILSGANPDQSSWGMFYFIGQFDGKNFISDGEHNWLDYGHDFFAGHTFPGPQNQRILMAWCGNWGDVERSKNEGWSGTMSQPRVLQLKNNRVIQTIDKKYVRSVDNDENHNLTEILEGIEEKHGIKLDYLIRKSKNYNWPLAKVEYWLDEGIAEFLINDGEYAMTQLLDS